MPHHRIQRHGESRRGAHSDRGAEDGVRVDRDHRRWPSGRVLPAALPLLVATTLTACGAGSTGGDGGAAADPAADASSSGQPATSPRAKLPPGYAALSGPSGRLTIGSPWGVACEAIELLPGPALPAALLAQVEVVVGEAGAAGLPVQVKSRPGHAVIDDRGTPAPERAVESVPINALTTAPPTKSDGAQIRRILNHTTSHGTSGAPRLTRVSLDLYLAAVGGDPAVVRKSVRHIIGVGFGLAPSVLTDSGIAGTLDESHDAFSATDLAALQVMSGCAATTSTR